jgi:hypothetical protein
VALLGDGTTFRIGLSSRPERPRNPARLSILLPTGTELLSIDVNGGPYTEWSWLVNGQDRLTAANRVHFDPSSQTLAYIPLENDRIVWEKLDIDGPFSRLGHLIIITSSIHVFAISGQDFRHQIEARSRAGAVKYRLSNEGPAGLTVAPEGLVTWKVPPEAEGKEITGLLIASDPVGHELTTVLMILV